MSCGCASSTSDVRNSAISRRLPRISGSHSDGGRPARARHASCRPVAQPSVAAWTASTVSSSAAQSCRRMSSATSLRLSDSSVTRNSARSPAARILASGRSGSLREPIASCAPGGRFRSTKATTSQALSPVSTCASSRTRTKPGAAARASPSSGRIRSCTGGTASERDALMLGSTSVIDSSASVRYVSRTTGSASATSSCTQAEGRPSACVHWRRTVVLPVPAGAQSTTSGAAVSSRASRRARRSTRRTRAWGGRSLAGSATSSGPVPSGAAARQRARIRDALPADGPWRAATLPPTQATLRLPDSSVRHPTVTRQSRRPAARLSAGRRFSRGEEGPARSGGGRSRPAGSTRRASARHPGAAPSRRRQADPRTPGVPRAPLRGGCRRRAAGWRAAARDGIRRTPRGREPRKARLPPPTPGAGAPRSRASSCRLPCLVKPLRGQR